MLLTPRLFHVLYFNLILMTTCVSPVHAEDCNSVQQNGWWRFNSSNTVIIFSHGVLSDSKSAWSSDADQCWPVLIRDDAKRFGDPSIFMGGYKTSFDSGKYGIDNAAADLLGGIKSTDQLGRAPPISKDNILFVAHSTGGLVVRYLLEANSDDFKGKAVGIFLLASPSRGSDWGTRIQLLSRYYGNRMLLQLTRNNEFVMNLDSRFADFIARRKMPRLSGMDVFESKFIIPSVWPFLSANETVVDNATSQSYFGSHRVVPGSDHFSIAKPKELTSASHALLWEFVEQRFSKSAIKPGSCTPEQLEGKWRCRGGMAVCTAGHDISEILITNNGSIVWRDGRGYSGNASVNERKIVVKYPNESAQPGELSPDCRRINWSAGHYDEKL